MPTIFLISSIVSVLRIPFLYCVKFKGVILLVVVIVRVVIVILIVS